MRTSRRGHRRTGSGDGRGLTGTAIARLVNYRARREEAGETAGLIRECGRRALVVHADVSNAAAVREMAAAVERDLGPVEILVNNAGVARVQQPESITERDWNEVMAVNLTSAFLVTQAVLPSMRTRRWGRLIFISSVAAQVGGIVGPHYAASKAGMLGLMRSYANLMAKEGITSNAIAPALIETDMVRSNLNAKPDRIPVGRFGYVDETAGVVVVLARNGYITGQTIHVNGGWYMT